MVLGGCGLKLANWPVFGVAVLVVESVLLLLYAFVAGYSGDFGRGSKADDLCRTGSEANCTAIGACIYDDVLEVCRTAEADALTPYYAMYQDIHAMIFVGFGFLMVFLHRYGYSAVGLNFFLSAVAIQWLPLIRSFWERVVDHHWTGKVELDITTLIGGDFAAAAVAITYGALLGKTTPVQMLFIVIFEIIFYSFNETIAVTQYHVVDIGGSMIIHAFGAYFGLGVSYMLGNKDRQGRLHSDNADNRSSRTHDLFAMIGTIFLWMFWPSFNGALALGGAAQHRVVINTVLSICSSAIVAFAWSNILRPGRRFEMVDIQNATLAGGVAVGCTADLVLKPWGAMAIGVAAGTLSVFAFVYLVPLFNRWGIHDTCGVHALHGLPGVLGGISGIIATATADHQEYGEAINQIFYARQGGRSQGAQAAYQLATLATTLGISIGSGLVTGVILRYLSSPPKMPFKDDEYWHVPADEEAPEIASPAHASDLTAAYF